MTGSGAARAYATATALAILIAAVPAFAGSVLVDLLDVENLEQDAPEAAIAPERMLDLLVVEVVRERIAAGALTWTTSIPVHLVDEDTGPSLAAHTRLDAGELFQLALLTRSPSAVASLAAAAGPGWERARARMRRTAARLELTGTVIPDGWPHTAPARTGMKSPTPRATMAPGHATVRDLARVAAVVAADPEIRRRLTLDGAPIADGALIVRATDSMIAFAAPGAGGARARLLRDPSVIAYAEAAVAFVARDGLELLAVASGTDAETDVWQMLERGLARYRRVELVHAGQAIGEGGEVDGRNGARGDGPVVTAQAFALTIPRAGRFNVSAWIQFPGRTAAPAEVNRPLGELVFEHAGRIIGAVPLIAPAAVAPNRWLDTARR